MYNGVGLSTARGSGTSAHVSRNSAALRKQRIYPRHVFKKNAGANRRRTKAAEEHERRRAIEVKVAEFEDEHSDEEEVRKFRERLLAELMPDNDEEDEQQALPAAVSKVDSRNDKLRRALGLPEEYEEGAAFRRMNKDENDSEEQDVLENRGVVNNDVSKSATAQPLVQNKTGRPRADDDDIASESSSSLSSSSLSSSSGIGKEAEKPKEVAEKSKPKASLVEGRSARRSIPNPTADWLRNNVNIASVPENNNINTNMNELPRDTTRTITMQRGGPNGVSKNAGMRNDRNLPIRSNELDEVHRRRAGLPPIGGTSHKGKISNSLEEVHRRRAGLPPAKVHSLVRDVSHHERPALRHHNNDYRNGGSSRRRSAEKELDDVNRRRSGFRDDNYGNNNGTSSARRSAEKELDDVHRRRAGLTNIAGPSERLHSSDEKYINSRPRDEVRGRPDSTGLENRREPDDTHVYPIRAEKKSPEANRIPDTEMKTTTERPKRRSRFGNRRMATSPPRDEIPEENREDRFEEHDDRRDGGRGERREKEHYDRREEKRENEIDDGRGDRHENERDERRERRHRNRRGWEHRYRYRYRYRYRNRSRSPSPYRSRSRSSSRDSYRRSSRRRRRRRRSPGLSSSPPRDRNRRRMSRETLRRRVVESMKTSHRRPSPRYSSGRSRSRSRSPPRRDRGRERRGRSRSPSRSRSRSRSRTPRRMSPGEQKRELEFRMRKLKRRQRGRSESRSSASSQSSSRSRYAYRKEEDKRYNSRSPERRKRRHL